MSTKKVTVKGLKKKADTAWSLYIRHRDGEIRNGEWNSVCITCGNWKPLKQMQCGHFITRGSMELRFNEMNTNAQCFACNVKQHGQQYVYSLKINEKYGEGTAEDLYIQSKNTHKFTIPELEQIISDANEYIKFLTKAV